MTLRCAVPVCPACFGVRRASEIAGLRVSDVKVDGACSVEELKVRQQKNHQVAAGQMAHVIALPPWQGACPVLLTSDWLWFRSWLARHRNRAGRIPSSSDEGLLFAGLDRARFGLGLASSRVSASWAEGCEGRSLSPRKGGASFYVMNGMAREATQELGGGKPPLSWRARTPKSAPRRWSPRCARPWPRRVPGWRSCASSEI